MRTNRIGYRPTAIVILVLVGVAGCRLRSGTRALAWLILARIAVTLVVLGFFPVDMSRSSRETFAAL